MKQLFAIFAVAALVSPALGAQLEKVNRFSSATLKEAQAVFNEMQAQAEEGAYTPDSFGMRIRAKSPEERFENTLKQAVYKAFSGNSRPEFAEVRSIPVTSSRAVQSVVAWSMKELSFSDASPADDYKSGMQSLLFNAKGIELYTLKSGNGLGYAQQLAIHDPSTGEFFVFGYSFSE